MGTSRKSSTCVLLMSLFFFTELGAMAQEYGWSVLLANGERFQQVTLTRVTQDSLIVTAQTNLSEWLLLDSLIELRRERRSAILPAVLIGAAGGGAIGYALKPTAVNQGEADVYSIAFGVVLGGVAGFVVGSNLQADEVFDMRKLDREAKAQVIKRQVGLANQNKSN